MALELQTQSAVETSRLYHDLNSLSQLRGTHGDDVAIKEAAKQFESMFYSMMMKSMRDANKAISPEPMFDSASLDLFQDMYDKQMSLELGTSSAGALGLADVLVSQLTGKPLPVAQNNTVSGPAETQGNQAANVAQFMQQLERQVSKTEQRSDNSDSPLPEMVTTAKTQVTADTNSAPTETISDKGLDYSSPTAFVASLLPYARKFAEKLNLDPRVLLAQAALETGWGRYVMRTADGISSNNLFGIKAGNSWQGEQSKMATLEFEGGQLRQKVAAFRAYPDPAESFADYVDLISTKPRYDKALGQSANPAEYLNELQQAGYATDPDYASKIYRILRSDTLNQAISVAEQNRVGFE